MVASLGEMLCWHSSILLIRRTLRLNYCADKLAESNLVVFKEAALLQRQV